MLAERISLVKPSATLEITAKAKQLKAQGKDIIGFGGGEPDFDTPGHIKQSAEKALREGFVYYTPTNGIPELREALAEKLWRENGIACDEKKVIVTPGAKQALYEAIMVLVNSGEEVLIPSPYWVSYLPMVQLASGKPVFINTQGEGYRLTAEKLQEGIGGKTKLLILNTPCNPTGVVLSRQELRAIAEVCSDHNIHVISDEIYEYMVYDGEEHVSIASLPGMEELAITVNGFSKSYSMTGWRLGYTCAKEEIVKAMQRLQAHSVSHPTSFVQIAGVEALRSEKSGGAVERMVKAFDERRKVMVELLKDLPGAEFPYPKGAFYIFADLSSYEEDSFKLSEYLLEEANVTAVPGEAFGENNKGCIRLSYAIGKEKIEEGLQRIGRAMDRY